LRLEGKIAIVTGAVQGIGRGIADRFVKEGALVAIVDYKSAAADSIGLAPDGIRR
jgi:NAD(P)-dependent dehydrogenase (short-subunit alcohol dehydrogenase family)